MKKTIFIFTILLVLISCKKKQTIPEEIMEETTTEQQEVIEIIEGGFSENALSQKMLGVDGIEYSFNQILKKHRGKPVLIDVWASWCPDCIKGMPKVHQLQEEFDLVYIFLSYDKTEQDWKIGIDKYKTIGENFLIQSEWKTGEFRKTIDLDWIPRYILVDKNGKIAHYRAIEADDPELIEKIKELTK